MIDKKLAADQVQRLLGSYPDYGKAPPFYVASLTGVFESLSDLTRKKLINPVHGLLSKHSILPTIADVLAMAKDFENQLRADAWQVRSTQKPQEHEKVISLDERRRVGEGMERLKAELRATKPYELKPAVTLAQHLNNPPRRRTWDELKAFDAALKALDPPPTPDQSRSVKFHADMWDKFDQGKLAIPPEPHRDIPA